MANQPTSTSRTIYIDSQAGELALQRLQTQWDKLTKKIDDNTAANKSSNKELAKLDDVNEKIKSIQDQFDKGLKPTLVQQQNLVSALRNELARLSENDPKFADKLKNYQAQNAELSTMQGKLALVTEEAGGFSKVFTHVAEATLSFSRSKKYGIF